LAINDTIGAAACLQRLISMDSPCMKNAYFKKTISDARGLRY
jgi:hypothetical protein